MTRREDLLIVAHRGATRPEDRGGSDAMAIEENTAESFAEAARQEADWVELDVRLASDGGLIVHHDPWYRDERTVYDTPSPSRPDGVPLLADALSVCFAAPGRPLGVNVEIKNSPGDLGGDHVPHALEVADAVVEVVGAAIAARPGAEVVVSSFDPPTIDRVRAIGGPPTAQLVFDVPGWPELMPSCVERGHSGVNPFEHFVDAAFVAAAAEAGLSVDVWTVDDPGRIVELAGLGVHAVITNRPWLARRAVEGAPPPR